MTNLNQSSLRDLPYPFYAPPALRAGLITIAAPRLGSGAENRIEPAKGDDVF